MALSKKFLKELNEMTDHFTIKVKGKAIKFGKEHEITNAKIKPMKEEYCTSDKQYEMEFVDTIVILTIFPASTSDDMLQYRDIGNIPHVPDLPDTSDVLGIVLYVEPPQATHLARPGTEGPTHEVPVREMDITNDNLAVDKCEKVVGLLDPMTIIGLAALKSTAHKGYSLATTMSTSIIIDPEGRKVAILSEWYVGPRIECVGHIRMTHFLISAKHPSKDDAKQECR
ncbi:hypothetical protein Cgig2_009710 [Carnegiea gigantea]|uniref:Uncharacterized protein n=1 Tax=Carnegiea gigantea TaxID=171969 RepID=A0A9Q1K3T3_9CARY|nr:hypothetical protein Cgig2_009710 [Carnegiea gigantea]